jgi:hypothetical protein
MVNHEGRDTALNHRQHPGQRFRLRGQQEAQGKRKGQHPLANRHFGKHVIDQVGGRLDHAPGAAAGAEPPALAGECNEMFVKAAIALDAKKAMLKQAALEVVFELLAHK